MNADTFAEQLESCAPTLEQLAALQVTGKAALDFIKSFVFEPRDSLSRNPDPLLDLISRYRAGHVELGMIRFAESLEKAGDLWIVGKCEADPLCINQVTGEVFVQEFGTDYTIFRCARRASAFLDAIALAETRKPRPWRGRTGGRSILIFWSRSAPD